jgi:hypothetical protein
VKILINHIVIPKHMKDPRGRDLPHLMASLGHEGQLEPIVVWKAQQSNRYILVDGYFRIHALLKLGKDHVVARVVDGPHVAPIQRVPLTVDDKLKLLFWFCRRKSWTLNMQFDEEKNRFNGAIKSKVVSQCLMTMGHDNFIDMLDELLAFCRRCE